MLAAKMFDLVIGIDIHIVLTPAGVPLPLPHPFIGLIFDPLEFLPFIGATVYVNGLPRVQAGSEARAVPPHFPIGGTFVKPPANEGEVFTGSSTVAAEGEPMGRMGSMVLTCSCIGMPAPPRKKKKGGIKSLLLPTSVLIVIPTGQPVMVGGPPTVSLMALGLRAGMFAGGKFFRRFIKPSNRYKRVCQKVHDAASTVTRRLPANARNRVHRAICTAIGHPVDAATGKVFTERTDFGLPGPLPLVWERVYYSSSVDAADDGPLGRGWHHPYAMSIGQEPATDGGQLAIRLADGRQAYAPPIQDNGEVYLRQEKLTLSLQWLEAEQTQYYVLTDEDYVSYYFRAAEVRADLRSSVLRSIRRPDGPAIMLDYDALGRLDRITDSAGRELSITNDARGRITRVAGPHPLAGYATGSVPLVSYTYDERGNLVTAADALGATYTYAYERHLLVRETNRVGLSFYFSYDDASRGAAARCLHTWGDGGIHDNTLVYDDERQTTTVTNSLKQATVYHWNEDGLVWRTVDPLGETTTTKYTEACAVAGYYDELGRYTQYRYDELGHLSETVRPDGGKLSIARQGHELHAVTDEGGARWGWSYDEYHRVARRQDPLGATTEYGYTGAWLTTITDTAGLVTELTYDPRGRHELVAVRYPGDTQAQFRYDELGRLIERRDERGNLTRYKLNLLGNVTKVREADGNVRKLTYDAEENIVHLRDRLREITLSYRGINRLGARTENGQRVEFAYNSEEELTGIVNEHGYAYRFGLDARGQVITEAGFDGLLRKYTRDAAGQVTTVLRPGNRSTHYTYDPAGRVTQVQYSDGTAEQYGYRADGELLEARNEAATVTYERDKVGRILVERSNGFEVKSKYDRRGDRQEIASSLGAKVVIKRDEYGEVAAVSTTEAEQCAAWGVDFERDAVGLELARSMPGGVKTRYERDRLGRPVRQRTSVGGGNLPGNGGRTLHQRSYVWGLDNRLAAIVDDGRGRFEFRHDAVGNLSAAKYPDGSEELRMPDAVGNLFKRRDRGGREYGPAGQLLRDERGWRYDYDPEGNLTEKSHPATGDRWSYHWNAAGMLTQVIRPNGARVRMTYDALGRRLSKRYRDGLTRWVWDGNVLLHEWTERVPPEARLTPVEQRNRGTVRTDATTQPPAAGWTQSGRLRIRRHSSVSSPTPAEDRAATEATDRLIQEVAGELTTFLFEPDGFAPLAKLSARQGYGIVSDHLGTPVGMYDTAGERVWGMELGIYGEVRRVEGDAGLPFRYPGQYHDPELELYYNRFRYYDPAVGGYISQDPIGLAGGNPTLYGYVGDTVAAVDFFGLMPWPNPVRQGHHLVYKNKAKSIGLDHLASSTETPTYFFSTPYVPGAHEAIHRAQKPHVGPTRGAWNGTADELFAASKKGLVDVDHVRGDLMIPKTKEILAKDVSPRKAFEKLEEWHKKKTACK